MLQHTLSAVAYHAKPTRAWRATSHASRALAYQILPDPSCMVCRESDNASFIIVVLVTDGKKQLSHRG